MDSPSSVPSLQDTLVSYISRNIDCVESLVDFPFSVGERILKKSKTMFNSYNDEQKLQVFSLFTAAYQSEMISKFKFHSQDLLFLFYYSDFLSVGTPCIVDLDLSDCNLEEEELLSSLGGLEHLQKLNLSRNNLKYEGWRKLLTPSRPLATSFKSLQILDTRGSCIPPKYLKKALCLKKLALFRFSTPRRLPLEDVHGFSFDFRPRRETEHLLTTMSEGSFQIILTTVEMEERRNPLTVTDSGGLCSKLRDWIHSFSEEKMACRVDEGSPQLYRYVRGLSFYYIPPREDLLYLHHTAKSVRSRRESGRF